MAEQRCHVCRVAVPPEVLASTNHVKPTCERCDVLLRAPPCKACGAPVRDAQRNDREAYHEQCRRCSSCSQVVQKSDVVKLAGRLLCQACDHLFGRFFAPSRRTDGDRMKEAFQAWDVNGNGVIEKDELRRVLKALKPDFPERDLGKLIAIIDKNRNGVIELSEFCDWIMQGSPMEITEDSFEDFVGGLMREAGLAAQTAQQDISEVQVQPTGVYFVNASGEMRHESTAFKSDSVELSTLDPEEFICKVECTEAGLILTMNTGRVATVKGAGAPFGPWSAPEGFKVIGLRAKADIVAGEGTSEGDEIVKSRVCGTDLAPLPGAKEYDSGAALRFAAENEYMHTLQKLLAKAAIDVNSFSPAGVTALMLAAQHGNVGAARLLLGCKANPALTDEDGWTALTFASRGGHTTLVDVLLQRGCADDQNDGGAALREALRHQHNSSARALLRAGLGPAPRGTFALEPLPAESSFVLPAPSVKPEPGAYSNPVVVELLVGANEEAKIVVKEEKSSRDKGRAASEALEDTELQELPPEAKDAKPGSTASSRAGSRPPSQGKKRNSKMKPEEEEEIVRVSYYNGREISIFYTLDGRDPADVGKRYRGPLRLAGARNHLRVVAMQGSKRSVVVDAVFVVCHYAVPDEIVTGSVKLRGFPEVQDLVSSSIATVLGEPQERVSLSGTEVSNSNNCWMRTPICDPLPRHSIRFDRSYATVRGNIKPFMDKFKADVEKAVGSAPQNMEVHAMTAGSEHKAGAIALDFTLPRALALQVAEQLDDEESFLLTQGKMRALFRDAEINVVEPLGERLKNAALHKMLQVSLTKRVPVHEVVGIGSGEAGVIAVALQSNDVKKLKEAKFLTKTIQEAFPDAEVGEISEGAEEIEFEYMVDVLNRAAKGDQKAKDGGTVVQKMNCQELPEMLRDQLAERSLNLELSEVSAGAKASSRGLNQLEFHLEWEFPQKKTATSAIVKDYLDSMCLIYSGASLLEVVDFRSAHKNLMVYDGPESPTAAKVCRSIGRAIRHSGDMMSDKGGEHHMTLDLDALPLSVTDIFFVLAAFDGDGLSVFPNPTVQMHDAVLGRKLMQYSLKSADAQAMVMCSLSRDPDHSIWVVHGLAIPTSGNAKNYDGIRDTLAKRQDGYSRWERRKNIVLLRALKKCERLAENSKSEFAAFMWHVLGLPISVFQLLVTWL